MSAITININSDDKLSLSSQETDKHQASQFTVDQSGDGGAPKFESDSSSPGSTSSQFDIGGPPQWLTDALSKEGKAAPAVSEQGTLQELEEGDGGAPPASFN